MQVKPIKQSASTLGIEPQAVSVSDVSQQSLNHPKLTVCCTFGAPLSPHTWSGTPLNICNVLKDLGWLEGAINCKAFASRGVVSITSAFSQLYYLGATEHFRGKILTGAKSRYLERMLALSKSDVLHMGFDHLPLDKGSSDQHHYLFFDYTWHLIQTNRLDSISCGKRLSHDADLATRTILHQMTHLFPVGEYLKDHLINHYGVEPAKITPVGTGRGLIQPFYGEKDYQNLTVLFVAKWGFDIKGGDIVVEGFRIAYQKNPKLKLILAGRKEYKKKFGDIPGVCAYGFISKQQLQELFNSATIFAMPARDEPWGLVYLEALSCKTPVIGLNRNALPEITQNGRFGFLIEEATPEAFAANLLKACEDPQRLRQMGLEGQQYCIQNFTWERTVEKILSVVKHDAEQS
jgi:glycosyltransferase involved in cell wall biosynthesis